MIAGGLRAPTKACGAWTTPASSARITGPHAASAQRRSKRRNKPEMNDDDYSDVFLRTNPAAMNAKDQVACLGRVTDFARVDLGRFAGLWLDRGFDGI